MNIDQAKNNIKIHEYLNNIGYKPISQRSHYFRYYSPFRNEKTASFDVNFLNNTFIDWGTGQSGTIIDLVMILSNTDVSGALKILSSYRPGIEKISLSPFKKQYIESTSKPITGTIGVLTNQYLINYLTKRKISREAWKNCPFLYQYSNKKGHLHSRTFHNLAWKNDKGGFELNNHNFKQCLGTKDITTIPGTGGSLNIFEGFMDYLSALTYFERKQLDGTTIVLNSVALKDRIINKLNSFRKIYSYLDNDNAGEVTFDFFAQQHTNIMNQSAVIYPNCKDFNDFIIQAKNKYITIV